MSTEKNVVKFTTSLNSINRIQGAQKNLSTLLSMYMNCLKVFVIVLSTFQIIFSILKHFFRI